MQQQAKIVHLLNTCLDKYKESQKRNEQLSPAGQDKNFVAIWRETSYFENQRQKIIA